MGYTFQNTSNKKYNAFGCLTKIWQKSICSLLIYVLFTITYIDWEKKLIIEKSFQAFETMKLIIECPKLSLTAKIDYFFALNWNIFLNLNDEHFKLT